MEEVRILFVIFHVSSYPSAVPSRRRMYNVFPASSAPCTCRVDGRVIFSQKNSISRWLYFVVHMYMYMLLSGRYTSHSQKIFANQGNTNLFHV